MTNLLALIRNCFRQDYSLTQGYLRYAGILGGISSLIFHFIEAGMGYRDWWPLRIVCVIATLSLVFYPRNRRLTVAEILYFDFAARVIFPVTVTYLYFLNKPDSYWGATLMLSGLVLGLLTKPQWLILNVVIGTAAALGLFTLRHGAPDPDALRIFWGVQCISACVGILAMIIQAGMHALHRRGLELAAANARTQEAQKREEEIRAAYAELSRREKVITRFVRPSLFEELARGEDPTEFEPVEKNLALLFCDIRGFTRLTEILGPRDKQEFLNRYLSLMTQPIVENGGEVDKIIGDCVMGIFPDGRGATLAAVGMRLQLQDLNRRMFVEGKPMIRNGIGIAKGPVMLGNFGSYEKLDRTVIGEAVNIASRLESKTKLYDLEVVVTEEVIRDLDPERDHFRWIDVAQVKGSTRRLKIFEVYSHQPPEVRRYKDSTRDLLEKALTIYFRKGFRDALRLFEAMQAAVPPHRLAPGLPMDNILQYYISHCRAWAKGDPELWDLIQKWDGVHVFLEK